MAGPNARFWEFRGVRFCFTIKPLMSCELADVDPQRPAGDVASPFGLGVDEAAVALECAPIDLAGILRAAHRRAGEVRRRHGDKLTNDCATCGRRLINHGYSAFVERDFNPKVDEDPDGTRKASAAIAGRLGMGAPDIRLKGVNGLKRSEARKWAWEQFEMARAAAKEAEASG